MPPSLGRSSSSDHIISGLTRESDVVRAANADDIEALRQAAARAVARLARDDSERLALLEMLGLRAATGPE